MGNELQQYMYKRSDSGNWQFRRPVPLHLQVSIGKRDITASLRTANYKEAAQRARTLAAEADALFAAHEARLSPPDEAPPPPNQAANGRPTLLERWMIPSLVERYKAAILETDELAWPR